MVPHWQVPGWRSTLGVSFGWHAHGLCSAWIGVSKIKTFFSYLMHHRTTFRYARNIFLWINSCHTAISNISELRAWLTWSIGEKEYPVLGSLHMVLFENSFSSPFHLCNHTRPDQDCHILTNDNMCCRCCTRCQDILAHVHMTVVVAIDCETIEYCSGFWWI